MTRILGPSGSRRRRRSLLGGLASFLLLSLLVVPNAFGVHDEGVFQLDGNATEADTTGAIDPPGDPVEFGDDWDQVCHQVTITDDTGNTIPNECTTSGDTTGATALSWVSEPDRSTSIFTGGGSKDPSDVNNWLWKNAGGLPDKDNLRHAFAAQYSATDELLYFGSDRFDNSGDAVQGFWFLQAPLAADGASSQGGNLFTDGSAGTPAHTGGPAGGARDGDLLVISDFSNGGDVSTINIYEWVSSGGDTTTHLDFVDGGDTRKCTAALSNDEFCGIVNASTITMPWAFTDKSNTPSNGALNGEFFEAGINLSGLGFGDECFSTVVAETRSSTSPSATLKDFVVGQFGSCESGLVTTPKDGNGGDIPAGGLPLGSGVSVKDSAVLTVTGVTTWTGNLSFFLCKVDAPGTCDGTVNVGTQVGATQTVTNATVQPILSEATTITETGRYCWRGEFISGTPNVPNATDGTAGECFTVFTIPTAISTTQSVIPNDSATISSSVAGDTLGAGGTVIFRLYDNATCTDDDDVQGATGLLYKESKVLAGGANSETVSTSNIAVSVSTDQTYSWLVTYSPAAADTGHTGRQSACNVEHFAIDFTNDAGPGTVFP
jgi:hypothetical protein